MLSAAQAFSLEPNYTLPSITYMTPESTMQRARDRGYRLMSLKGIPDGDETLVCTNWVCPTSIVVNAQQYLVEAFSWSSVPNYRSFRVMTTNDPPTRVAYGDIDVGLNEKVARQLAFGNCAITSLSLSDYASRLIVRGLDSSTNALVIINRLHPSDKCDIVYKNIIFTTRAPTNAFEFALEIINAGLPEEERIPLPPTQ